MNWRPYRSDGHQLEIDGKPMARIKRVPCANRVYWVVTYFEDPYWRALRAVAHNEISAKVQAERAARGELPPAPTWRDRQIDRPQLSVS